jgi:hypothetical protein
MSSSWQGLQGVAGNRGHPFPSEVAAKIGGILQVRDQDLIRWQLMIHPSVVTSTLQDLKRVEKQDRGVSERRLKS